MSPCSSAEVSASRPASKQTPAFAPRLGAVATSRLSPCGLYSGHYEKRLCAELGARKTADESYEEIAARLAAHYRQHGGWRPSSATDDGDSGKRKAGDHTRSVSTAESRFNVVVAHNLSESNLHFADQLGAHCSVASAYSQVVPASQWDLVGEASHGVTRARLPVVGRGHSKGWRKPS